MEKILVINPGSTSTKIAVYCGNNQLLVRSIQHTVEDLSGFDNMLDQFDYRKNLVLKTLEEADIAFDFDAIIGRGGLLKPIPGGVYLINEQMLADTRNAVRSHACNLGCLIAYDLAASLPHCKAFIADPGVVDEMDEKAHITGSPLLPRIVIWHALNQRATARKFAHEHHLAYEQLNLIVVHLGGGISIGSHCKGKVVDVNNALDGEGPFSPERAGTLPVGALIDLCYSGKFSCKELKKKVSGNAGLVSHLGSTDVRVIVSRIEKGDTHAKMILDAMIYQVAKSVGAASIPLLGKVDAILLTGGMAYSSYIVTRLQKYIAFLAPVYVYPGENEMEALAMNALGVLRHELPLHHYS